MSLVFVYLAKSYRKRKEVRRESPFSNEDVAKKEIGREVIVMLLSPFYHLQVEFSPN